MYTNEKPFCYNIGAAIISETAGQ